VWRPDAYADEYSDRDPYRICHRYTYRFCYPNTD
jgi:hypothetical protein